MSRKRTSPTAVQGGHQTSARPTFKASLTGRPQPSHHLGPVGGGQVHAGGGGVFVAGLIAAALRRWAFRSNLTRALFEPGLAVCQGLQTTTVAENVLRVLTIRTALTAKPNRDQREEPLIFKRILEL